MKYARFWPVLRMSNSNECKKRSTIITTPVCCSVIRSCGLILIILTIIGCKSGTDKLYKESKIVMGTVVEITVANRSEEQARIAIKEAMVEFHRIDDLMSSYKPGSVVSKVNQTGSAEKVPVGEEVFHVLQDSVAISEASDGAFDATIWPVSQLWGFEQGGSITVPELITDKLALVGYKELLFDDSSYSVGFNIDGMGLDLGAIAKGWAIDRAIEKLTTRGIRSAIIDAGGDLRIIGTRPGKDFWRIGVQHPRDPGTLIFTFDLKDTAIVTSGDYERFFMADGVRYHHILDPATGQPARGSQSVTVLAPTAAEADACATAAFVLGPSQGVAFLRTRPGVRGVIVGADGSLHWTDEALAGMAHR